MNATIKHHLNNNFPKSEVIEELTDKLYVDDWLSGADSVEEGLTRFNEARSVLAKAGMSLAKWSSNCKTLTDKFDENVEQGVYETTKILGMQWCLTKDCFKFKCINVETQEMASTKRAVLSVIARIFDPLGILCPFIMTAKILFQDVWRHGLSWGETLPDELLLIFQKWIKGINIIKSWQIERCYFSSCSWKMMSGIELHAFGDASEKGYGACIYLRVPCTGDSFKVSFVIGRGRVAPIKKISLPRLELLGALLCARLTVFVKAALRLPDVRTCWSDSKVVLSWIKGDPSKWKTFVANRVSEIQSVTSPTYWYHCPGRDNPADLVSRGVFAEDLISCIKWMSGPAWLSGHSGPMLQGGTLVLQEEGCENLQKLFA